MSDPSTASIVSTPRPSSPPTPARPPATARPAAGATDKPRGLLGDAWRDLRRKPLFWISATFIVLFLLMAAFPSLFTSGDPDDGDAVPQPRRARRPTRWFGYDVQGRDVYARVDLRRPRLDRGRACSPRSAPC